MRKSKGSSPNLVRGLQHQNIYETKCGIIFFAKHSKEKSTLTSIFIFIFSQVYTSCTFSRKIPLLQYFISLVSMITSCLHSGRSYRLLTLFFFPGVCAVTSKKKKTALKLTSAVRTSSIFVAEVGKPPDVSEAHGVADAAEDEVRLSRPLAPFLRTCQVLLASQATSGARRLVVVVHLETMFVLSGIHGG